jgi:hypothetical protein
MVVPLGVEVRGSLLTSGMELLHRLLSVEEEQVAVDQTTGGHAVMRWVRPRRSGGQRAEARHHRPRVPLHRPP